MNGYEIIKFGSNSQELVTPQSNTDAEEIRLTFEEQSGIFQNRLSEILDTPLSVESISDHGNNLLNSLIDFTQVVVNCYQAGYPTETIATQEELENQAFTAYGIENIGTTLNQIQSKIEHIESITQFIANYSETTTEIITPTHGTPYFAGERVNESAFKQLFPRLITLLYILESDFKVPKENVRLLKGATSADMHRDEPYYRIEIPDLNRLVYICDEKSNSTYIFDQELLDELGISVELLDGSTKEERDILIKEFSGIGKRMVHRAHWRHRMEEFLGYTIPDPVIKDENAAKEKLNLPHVSVSETDPWRGFWTDSQGNHWGPILKIAQSFGSNNKTVQNLIEESTYQTIEIVTPSKAIRTGYCLEEIQKLPVIQHKEGLPTAATEGDWKGYFTDTEGKHWAVPYQMEDKTNLQSSMILKEVKKSHLGFKEINDRNNKIGKAYCYEEVIEIPKIKKYIESPKVEKSGEWIGYYTDFVGNHWSNKQNLTGKLNCTIGVIEMVLRNNPTLEEKEVISFTGLILKSYCLEDIKKLSDLHAWQTLPKITIDKEKRSFYQDENSIRWATPPHLAELFSTSVNTLQNALKDKENILARGDRGPAIKLYSYDELLHDSEFREKLAII